MTMTSSGSQSSHASEERIAALAYTAFRTLGDGLRPFIDDRLTEQYPGQDWHSVVARGTYGYNTRDQNLRDPRFLLNVLSEKWGLFEGHARLIHQRHNKLVRELKDDENHRQHYQDHPFEFLERTYTNAALILRAINDDTRANELTARKQGLWEEVFGTGDTHYVGSQPGGLSPNDQAVSVATRSDTVPIRALQPAQERSREAPSGSRNDSAAASFNQRSGSADTRALADKMIRHLRQAKLEPDSALRQSVIARLLNLYGDRLVAKAPVTIQEIEDGMTASVAALGTYYRELVPRVLAGLLRAGCFHTPSREVAHTRHQPIVHIASLSVEALDALYLTEYLQEVRRVFGATLLESPVGADAFRLATGSRYPYPSHPSDLLRPRAVADRDRWIRRVISFADAGHPHLEDSEGVLEFLKYATASPVPCQRLAVLEKVLSTVKGERITGPRLIRRASRAAGTREDARCIVNTLYLAGCFQQVGEQEAASFQVEFDGVIPENVTDLDRACRRVYRQALVSAAPHLIPLTQSVWAKAVIATPASPPTSLSAPAPLDPARLVLEKAGLNPHPATRSSVIARIFAAVESEPARITPTELAERLGVRVVHPPSSAKSDVQNVIYALMRSGCLRRERDGHVKKWEEPFLKLRSRHPSRLDESCIELYRKVAEPALTTGEARLAFDAWIVGDG